MPASSESGVEVSTPSIAALIFGSKAIETGGLAPSPDFSTASACRPAGDWGKSAFSSSGIVILVGFISTGHFCLSNVGARDLAIASHNSAQLPSAPWSASVERNLTGHCGLASPADLALDQLRTR